MRRVLETAANAAMIVMCGVGVWTVATRSSGAGAAPARAEFKIPTEPLVLDGAATQGSPTAPVAMVIFSDFECPFCARLAVDTLPTLHQQYVATGKLLIAFRHMPIPKHKNALVAAVTSVCANNKGKFWEFHDAIFSQQSKLDVEWLRTPPVDTGYEGTQLLDCINTKEVVAQVESDKALAGSLGITGTPMVLIGRLTGNKVTVTDKVAGAQPVESFTTAIDKLLK